MTNLVCVCVCGVHLSWHICGKSEDNFWELVLSYLGSEAVSWLCSGYAGLASSKLVANSPGSSLLGVGVLGLQTGTTAACILHGALLVFRGFYCRHPVSILFIYLEIQSFKSTSNQLLIVLPLLPRFVPSHLGLVLNSRPCVC